MAFSLKSRKSEKYLKRLKVAWLSKKLRTRTVCGFLTLVEARRVELLLQQSQSAYLRHAPLSVSHFVSYHFKKIIEIAVKCIVDFGFFRFYNVLIYIFKHVVRSVSHALLSIFIGYSHCQHDRRMIMT